MNLFSKINILFIIFIFIGTSISAEKVSSDEKKLYKKAKQALVQEKYIEAKEIYESLIKIAPKNGVYNFEAGLSYYLSDFERAKSIKYFETALTNFKEDTIPEVYYYLARAYHINGEYKKSTESFNKFKPYITLNSNAGKELLKKAEYYIKNSDNGNKYLAEKNEDIAISNLGNTINSSYSEYAPIIKSGNQDILLFTSRRKTKNNKTDIDLLPYENVYVAQKTGDNWVLLTDKKEIEKYVPHALNSKKHNAGIIYSTDGKTLYTYKNDAIWKSILENNKWTELVELDQNINSSKYNIPSVSLSKDGNTIFFVSYRKDGAGGKDIYQSIKKLDGNWSKAENLGSEINTQFDEDSPFLSEDGKTLYFSSKGHNSIGGYDIFKSELNNDKWSAPQNMGIPINSAVNDIYLILDSNNMNGYFSSDRDGGIGGMDIYSLCMYCPKTITNIINGLLVDNNNSPINGSITIKNINSDKILGNYQTTVGVFSSSTESMGKHELIVEANNYEKQLTYIDLPSTSSTSDIRVELNQFKKDNDIFQIISIISSSTKLNRSDTIKLEQFISVIDTLNIEGDTITEFAANIENNTTIDPSSSNEQISYLENFGYNINEINTNSSNYTNMLNSALKLVGLNSKVYIEIESSASRVPTKTYKTNINLASLRGDQARDVIIKSLVEKGVSEDEIVVNKINSMVSGPKYIGDYKNLEKYHKFQYVKITIK